MITAERKQNILKQFIEEHTKSYVAGIFILIASSFVAMTIPKIIGIITDGLNGKNMPASEVYRYVLILAGVSVAVFLLKFTWRYFLIGNCRSVECYLRDRLFKHLQTLPLSFYSNSKTGDLVAHAINDVQAVRMTFGFGSIQILDGAAATIISIWYMAGTINPVLTAMALAPVPVAVFIMVKVGKLIRLRFRKVQEAFAAISQKVQENISGIRVIKAFAQEEEEVDKFLKYSQDRVDTQMNLTRVSALLGPCAQLCFGISFLFFIVYGSGRVINGTISLGDYVAFNTYMMAIMGPIMNISRIIDIWQRGIASYRRLKVLFDTPGAADSNNINDKPEESQNGWGAEGGIRGINGTIEIKNLNFTYPGASGRSLKNINLVLEQGKTLGILGKTGCGKTTLMNLLLKLYDVDEGQLFFDGTDINDIPSDVVRESIGYVPQDNFLFSTTIRENIEFFRRIYSGDEVEEAAKLSGVYDNIMSFPEGFDTVIGERGTTLSGGQKQRISIARALVKNPSILILDDSLSAVDTKTEEEIIGNIRRVLSNRTGIIISHRVSTVRYADEIIFMENGRIVERGAHDQLMNLKGRYFRLYASQNDTAGMNGENEDLREGTNS